MTVASRSKAHAFLVEDAELYGVDAGDPRCSSISGIGSKDI